MVIDLEKMDMAVYVQILDKAVCISHSTNIYGKRMNPTILYPTMGTIVEQTQFFNFSDATSLGEEKLSIQIC